ncbi:hypothetical protein [Vibrio rotiferianus]|jgi:hypothetical protein
MGLTLAGCSAIPPTNDKVQVIEVSDWRCANGNYLEEMYLFVKETQASG